MQCIKVMGRTLKMCVRLESMKLCRHGQEIYVNVHLTYYWKFTVFIEFFIITHYVSAAGLVCLLKFCTESIHLCPQIMRI